MVAGATGALIWRAASGHDTSEPGASDVGRTWPGIVIADIDDDGQTEIVTAHNGGYVGVYTPAGRFKPGWPERPYTAEIRSLAVDDLDGDGQMEIVFARASSDDNNRKQWTVLEPNGAVRPGWPRLSSSDPGYGYGAYNQNVGVADIDGDSRGEIIGPSDVHYISAFNDDGSQIPANARYNNSTPRGPKVWSQVGVHLSDAVDLRGYANCGTEHRPNFAVSAPAIADLTGDGTHEVVVVGNVSNCGVDPPESLAHIPFIFNADRSRWSAGNYDWTAPPPLGGTSGAPLSEDYNLIQSALPNPVLADLDGDGVKELLFAAYDGKLHAFWMDKTEHGNWPVNVAGLAGDISFASEPAVADLDNDGQAEVIFGTWPKTGGQRNGKLIIADAQGRVLHQAPLPAPLNSDPTAWNGVLAAPTLANIDSDPDLEVVLGTVGAGIVAYDLPGTADARVLWGTGRGSLLRTGAAPAQTSFTAARPSTPQPGDTVTFRLTLADPLGAPQLPLEATIALPARLTYVPGSLAVSGGSGSESAGTINWNGTLRSGKPATVTFQARIAGGAAGILSVVARVRGGHTADLSVSFLVGGRTVSLPLARR